MDYNNMTLREKVFQTFILNTEKDNFDKCKSLEEFFETYPVGGLYYLNVWARDYVPIDGQEAYTPEQLLNECKRLSKHPLVICADAATIGDDGMILPDFEALGGCDSEDLAFDVGKAMGMQMNYNDIDWVLGPTIDMPINRTVSTISSLMSDDPEFTGRIFSKVVDGIQSQGVAATVKHFPGIGTHCVNMHAAPGQNILDFETWMKTYGYTYREMIKRDVMCVMTSHISLKSYSQKADYGPAPIATFSKDLTLKLLKEELGFKGVVVTDALTMGGLPIADQVERAVAAFACGADFLLWPPVEAGDRIVQEIENGNIPMSRLDDALERISKFRKKLSVRKENSATVDEKFVNDTFKKVINGGIVLVKNELSNVPLKPEKKNVLVSLIAPNSPTNYLNIDNKMKNVERFCNVLNEHGFNTEIKLNYMSTFYDKVEDINKKYDCMIFLQTSPYEAGSLPGCMGGAWGINMHPSDKKIIVNFSSPFFLDDYYSYEKTIIHMNSTLNELTAVAAAKAVLGELKLNGKLQVKSVIV